MLKKVIKYNDYNDNPRTGTFYFNLSRAEVTELELSKSGGVMQYIERISATQNGPELFKMFKDLIVMSVGEKSPDGQRFVKSQEIVDNFLQSEAYSELLMEITSGDDAAEKVAAFIEGILPKVS